ncbi:MULTISPECIES: hypothetical protein [unclassified Xanthomonas]|uniref:hypothetical protein n=1 Tax=unclassified Xanthomonas TaxID=2643310 RepID=UPI0021E040B9|nr:MULTISPECIES: hypothetical protein [unclassified Xanthomonas]UYC21158.1 hypothetical protein NUG20_02305 [Xanthomonas sp. CFBP 8443]
MHGLTEPQRIAALPSPNVDRKPTVLRVSASTIVGAVPNKSLRHFQVQERIAIERSHATPSSWRACFPPFSRTPYRRAASRRSGSHAACEK